MEGHYLGVVRIRNEGNDSYVVGIYSKKDHKSEDYTQWSSFEGAISKLCKYFSKDPELLKEDTKLSDCSPAQNDAVKDVKKLVLEQMLVNQ